MFQNNPFADLIPNRSEDDDPYTIKGPPRKPAPQTGAQAQKDVIDVQRGQVGLQHDQLQIERDRQQLEKDRLEFEKTQRDMTERQFTEDQGKSAGWLRRAFGANKDYEALGLGAPGRVQDYLRLNHPNIANGIPEGVGGSSPEWQQATATQKEFINALLRRDTGATINDQEFRDAYRTYFPQPGETDPRVIAQHAAARQRAIEGLLTTAGPAADYSSDGKADPTGKNVRDWIASLSKGGSPGGGPPTFNIGGNPSHPGGMDRTEQSVLPRGPGESLSLGEGTETIKDPSLAGLNAKVNAMLKAGKPIGQIAKLITDAGIPINQVLPSLQQAAKFRRDHPDYRGDWEVHLDEQTVPLKGANRALNNFTNSAPGTATGEYVNAITGNHLDNITQALGGNGEMVNLGLQMERQRHPYAAAMGDVAAGASLYGVGRSVAGKLGSRFLPSAAGASGAFSAPAIAGDAAMGGYMASGANGTNLIDPTGMAEGAALGAGLGVAARGAINSVAGAVSPSGGRLAPLYEANPDFRPSLGQRVGGAYDRFEQANNSIPFAGGAIRNTRNNAIDQAQRGAFNQALGEIGDQLPPGTVKGTAAHAYMQRSFNSAYSKVRSQLSFAPDSQWTQDFGAIVQDAQLLGKDSRGIFEKLANDVGNRLRMRGGALTGEDYNRVVSRIDSKVRGIRKSGQGDQELADVLDRLSSAIDDAAARRSGPQAAEALNAVRRGYAKAVMIENAARGAGPAGEFSGAQLDNAVKQGSGSVRNRSYLRGEVPMQDYAGAMRELGDSLPNSGSIDRALATGGAVAAGLTKPALLAPSAAAVASNLPGIRSLLGLAMAPNRSFLDPVREEIERRSRLGASMITAPMLGYSLSGQ